MKDSIVFMFSGQGSQYYMMGKELAAENPVFRSWMLKLDNVVRQINGESVLAVLYQEGRKKNEDFVDVRHTHPAIFMVEYAIAQALIAEGREPDYLLGSSLGEYVAAALAGVTGPENILEALLIQAELMEKHCKPGRMLAVLADPTLYQQDLFMKENSELAAVSFPSHFVVSGEIEKLKILERYLQEKKIITQVLPVAHGFHSSLLEPIAPEYMAYLKTKSFQPPFLPIVSSLCQGRVLNIGPEYFWDVLRQPIGFAGAIKFLEERGPHTYLDLGPSGTLEGFARRNLAPESESAVLSILNPFGNVRQNLAKVHQIILPGKKSKNERTVQDMTAYLFPGQGSQHKGMGEGLFDEFKDLTAQADEILGYSVKELCLEDPGNKLIQTQYTQPALYVVNSLYYLKKVKETGKKPVYVAGHSLGEYNALFAAQAFDFATGVKLVKKRGELMAKATGGGMAAVIGLDQEKIEEILQINNLKGIDIANYNTPSQMVISGAQEDIERAKPVFEKAGVRMYVILRVSGAFHSHYMESAKKEFAEYLEGFKLQHPGIPVISNAEARPYKKGEVKKNLVEQITSSVKWTDTIRYLMGKGVTEMEQVGPGNVIRDLVKTIKKEAEPLLVMEDDIKAGPKVENDRESFNITALKLGNPDFKKEYNLKYAYVAGSMYRGISSEEMVVKLGQAGMMGFFGTGGLSLSQVEEAIISIQNQLKGQAYGLGLLYNPANPELEDQTVDLFLKYGVRNVEASAYLSMNKTLVRYRLKGLSRDKEGKVLAENRIIAKLSRPEVAEAFMSPAPQRIVETLLAEKRITRQEAEMSREIPMAEDICVEADSAGHTDQGSPYVLMPAMLKLRDEIMVKHKYCRKIRVGAAGGIGAPESAAAAFILGADFIVTGSINQCTAEAGISELVKDMLEDINVQDTGYAPAGDMFELGAKVQVLKKGVFFPARANKLFELYRNYNSLEELDEKTRKQIQERYFQKSFEEVWRECKSFFPPEEIAKAEQNPKHKMALVFRWYFGYSTRLALRGDIERKVDFQVQCGPALGAFNQWVKGTSLEKWRNRHVDEIGKKLMEETALVLNKRLKSICS